MARSLMSLSTLGVLVLGAVTGACSPQPQASEGQPTRSPASVLVPPPLDTARPAASRDSGPDDRPRLARLEQEALALARKEGCTSAAACPPNT